MVWRILWLVAALAVTLSTCSGFAVPQIFQKTQLEDGVTTLHEIFRLTRDEMETNNTSDNEEAEEDICASLQQCWSNAGLPQLIRNIFDLELVNLTQSLPVRCPRIEELSLPVIETNSRHPAISVEGTTFVANGNRIVLVCNATGVIESPEDIDWFKDGVRVLEDDMRQIDIDHFHWPNTHSLISKLEITQSDMADTGTYVCRSSNLDVISMAVHVLDVPSCNVDDCLRDRAREHFRVAVGIANWVCSHRQDFETGINCWADPFKHQLRGCLRNRPKGTRSNSQYLRACFANTVRSLPNCTPPDQDFFIEFSSFVLDAVSR